MSTDDVNIVEFAPGTLVKTPDGRAWVNAPPLADVTRPGMVFVRLDDNATKWFSPRDLVIVQ